MKLDNSASIFNMGDTSIRVKQIVDVHKVILRQLDSFMGPGVVWRGNSEANEEFYRLFIDEIVRLEEEEGTELFRDFARARTYVKPSLGKMGMRGRTLTNALVKSGLIDTDRRLSTVGRNYLEGSTAAADPVEQLLGLDTDNLVYLRQYLKMRIYSCDGKDFFCIHFFSFKQAPCFTLFVFKLLLIGHSLIDAPSAKSAVSAYTCIFHIFKAFLKSSVFFVKFPLIFSEASILYGSAYPFHSLYKEMQIVGSHKH